MWLLPGSLVAGVAAAHAFNSVPPVNLIATIALAGLGGLCFYKTRLPALALLACCACLWQFHLRLEDRLDHRLAGQVLLLEGTVRSIPAAREDHLEFLLEPAPRYRTGGIPSRLRVRWYRDWPELHAGQHWRLELLLKPPWGRVNFLGGDPERWLYAQGIGGLATARGGQRLTSLPDDRGLDTMRAWVIGRMSERIRDERQRGVLQALATADRSGIRESDRRLLQSTGTAHLLAISGLHVSLAAWGGFWLARLPFAILPLALSRSSALWASAAGSLAAAVAYAALAGFGIPTRRAVLMLAVALAALMLPRRVHPLRAWLLALAAVSLLDPFAPLRAGFWFSFLAVAALLCVFHPRPGHAGRLKTLLTAQAGVLVVLAPLSLAWFQSATPAGFVANLAAIPWVSLGVVPPVLLGVAALPFSEALAGALWSLAAQASALLFMILEFLDRLQGPLSTVNPPRTWQVVLALAGTFVLLLPRGLPWRWHGLFLLLPLLLPPAERAGPGAAEVEVLDVGQGTAVVLRTPGRTLLYDSGPGDGRGRDLVRSVIEPAVARLARGGPDTVVISHGDLDHAGGMHSMLERHPAAAYLASLPARRAGIRPCRSQQGWSWPGARFDVLHPSAGLPYLGNDSSCVISVQTAGGRILLAGDISRAVEARLLHAGLAPHRLLLVPHHGSRSSSSALFIETAGPDAAVATAALGNRFGFPREAVRRNYEERGVAFWSTGECGAIRLRLDRDGRLEARSARRVRDRVWRHPAAPNCP